MSCVDCADLRAGWTTCLESASDISSALCNACSSVCGRRSKKNAHYIAQLDARQFYNPLRSC